MRSLLALYLMVRHLSSSPPTNIRKVRGRKKGMLVLILNASKKSTETGMSFQLPLYMQSNKLCQDACRVIPTPLPQEQAAKTTAVRIQQKGQHLGGVWLLLTYD